MINPKTNTRELAYVVAIDEIRPIEGYDRVEHARVGGWWVVVRKDEFKVGDKAIYIEIDSKVPATEPFAFMEKCKYRVKTQKMCKTISQGLIVHPAVVGLEDAEIGDFVTEKLGITYYEPGDNERKNDRPHKKVNKYQKMMNKNPKLAKNKFARWLFKFTLGKWILWLFFGKSVRKMEDDNFPTHFPFIRKTDQERVECMPWVLKDKTPFIVSMKCDGSSATYILERLPRGNDKFYICSRNKRILSEDQQAYHDQNYYWEVAQKYDIENKLRDFLAKHTDLDYVCWQGEICAPKIQSNPHKLTETHFYAFHMIDSKIGKWDIREAKKVWDEYNLESVPIVDENYILPDNMDEFKKSADGMYDASVCEGKDNCKREGFVYYKTTDPNFSFKNVSIDYLMRH